MFRILVRFIIRYILMLLILVRFIRVLTSNIEGMVMRKLGELIYTKEGITSEAVAKAEYHLPKIIAPDNVKAGESFKVRITVGPHPNTPEHYIRRIELYFSEEGRSFNPILIAYVDLVPLYSEPDVEFTVKLGKSGTLHAVEYCTLHGLWETTKDVIVK